MKRVIIGADHAGFRLKEKVEDYFKKKKIKFEDVGAYFLDKNDDYPDYALKLAKKAKQGNKGILFCASGTGMAIAANKIKGVRAGVAINEDEVLLARKRNDINVLCLNSVVFKGISRKLRKNKTFLDIKVKPVNFKQVINMINIFLKTKFEGGRHKRRLDKISKIERL